MFLEKFSRFVRIYNLHMGSRHKGAADLPLYASAKSYSVFDALKAKVEADEAHVKTSNGDIVELVHVSYQSDLKCLVLLFHRASPNAADPAYRKKAVAANGKTISIRRATKAADEDQSVSAHLVIKDKKVGAGAYASALEEIPGLSMSAVRPIISLALQDYRYSFKRNGKDVETYTTFRPEGVKSETLDKALAKGEIDFIKLTRPAQAPFVDADGMFQPITETMRIRVKGQLTSQNWRDSLGRLMRGAKKAGWTDFGVDIGLDDKRRRTVKIEREAEAKEILFVRSEQVSFDKELSPCTDKILSPVVEKFAGLLAGK